MSFIKVKDPRKREELVRDFIETRKRIKDNFIARKVGEAEYQTGLTKLFKPVTETQKATAKEITDAQKAATEKITQELLPIKEGIKDLPGALSFPPIEGSDSISLVESLTEKEITNLGPIAGAFLKSPWNKESLDLDFGLNTQNEERKFKIGDKFVKFDKDNIKIGDDTFTGTEGFWALITAKNPINELTEITDDDKKEYKRLLIKTNAIFKNNDPTETRSKGNHKGDKWEKIIKPIWEEIKPKPTGLGGKGKGRGKGRGRGRGTKKEEDPKPGTSGEYGASGYGLILPSDPNALIDRFDLLFSSKKAGHTGVKNEIVAILDELKRQGVINVNEYKKLNYLIKK